MIATFERLTGPWAGMPETMVGDVEHGYVLSNDANTVLLSEREAEATLTRWRRIAEQEGPERVRLRIKDDKP